MAAGRIVIEGYQPILDGSANPVPGALATFYENGTTTLASVFADASLTTPLPNPVVADSSGQLPSIFADANLTYNVKMARPSGAQIALLELVRAIGPTAAPTDAQVEEIIEPLLSGKADALFAVAYTGANARTVNARFNEMPISVGEFSALVVSGDWTAAINAALAADRNVYLPGRVGGYYVTGQLNMRSTGNYIVGDGVDESYLVIDADFNMAATGVVFAPVTASEQQAGFHEVGFRFAQPGDYRISAIAVSAGGSGYTTPPAVSITGGGGTGATARAVLTAGAVTSLVVTRPGQDYGPVVSFSGGGGYGAKATAILTGNVVSSFAIQNGGQGYATPPTVSIAGVGSGVTGTAVLTGDTVTSVTLGAGGSGYVAPSVTFTGGGGSGATAGTVTRVPTLTRANFIQYPYAISPRGVSRMMIGNIRITGGYNGLDLRDNTGGLMGGRWEIGCINEGVTGGGATGGSPALDFWHPDTIHSWPFGFQDPARLAIYSDGSTVAARLGRIDGLDIKTLSTFTGRVILEATAGEGPFGTIASLQLDGRVSRLEMAAGKLAIGSTYSSSDLAGDFAIRVTGGQVAIGSMFASGAGLGTQPLVEIGNAKCSIAAGTFQTSSLYPAAQVTGGNLSIATATLIGMTNTTRSQAQFKQVSGSMSLGNILFENLGTGSGPAVHYTTDDVGNYVDPGIMQGWTLTLPAAPAGGYAGSYGQSVPVTRTLAAADPLILRSTDRYVTVTGNTSFGTIQGTRPGHEVTLVFSGTPTLTNNPGTISYAGAMSFVAQAGLILDLIMTADGWKERGRSIPTTATGWITGSVTPTPAVGTLTSASASLSYRRDANGMIEGSLTITITTRGTADGAIALAMPFASEHNAVFTARDLTTGEDGVGSMAAGTPDLAITGAANSFLGGSGSTLVVSFRYRVDV